MAIEAKSEEELQVLASKITLAREWARKHFRADEAKDGRLIDENMELLPPSFFVDFPTADTMTVAPSTLGIPSVLTVAYRLSFRRDGGVVWRPQAPFGGFAPLYLRFENGQVVEDVSEARKRLLTYAMFGVIADKGG